MTNPPTQRLLENWRQLSGLPGGKWLFARLLGRSVPYTGTIKPQILAISPGHSKVAIDDRHRVRNHLGSVHAVALANLGELATGLALSSALPADARGIPTRLSMEYMKKARGQITAECSCSAPSTSEEADTEVVAELRNEDGDLVARAIAVWRTGPRG